MRRMTWVLAAVVVLVSAAATFSQMKQERISPGPTFFTVEDMQALYKQTVPDKTFHQGALVADMGEYNIGINVQHQIGGRAGDPSGKGPQSFHSKVTEIYYIVEGTATVASAGGPISDIKESDWNTPEEVRKNNGQAMSGPGGSGIFKNPPVVRKVKKGDFILFPPYTSHSLSDVSTPFRYLVFRVDPHRTLPTGFVNKYLIEARGGSR